ncbi:unnamed protein product [[Actinomadura] parvosata subsp. kistnae]|uniref:Uncharacterized protein n=2 Tax=Nonomuraea TaxID=83681 RepID=A0A1V0AHD8_9ACTN|nr:MULTISPECIES: hypothetical protein [unclassified Nonomuraea]AQZ69603.1 hypothetical protein BKM31_56320 [Nonomuraea sp. ATCC 55076]NJP94256.1 hypothetical protein [Nonomuraea sp. FMUSA5-5]SPL91702.1 unnamed protein product [Actinomadura parvosata subsp. kistnae]
MAWRIAMDATEATLSASTSPDPLFTLPSLDGAFYLRPGGGLAGFALRLPLPARRGEPQDLWWEAADLDREGRAWLRLGQHEVCRAVSVLCAEIPGERPYEKIVLETAFSSWSLRLPGVPLLRPRRLTLRLFSELRPAESTPDLPR